MTSLLARPERDALPAGAVARVNGVLIRQRDFERATAALAADRRSPLVEEDRRHVLDRLIDEELLVQYGIFLGLARSDRRIRADFVSAVIAAQVAFVDGYEASDAEVKNFFRENLDFFSPPGRLWARSVWIAAAPARTAEQALDRAQRSVARLRSGEPFGVVEADLGDPQLAPIPDVPLPPAKLREYVGPTALVAAAALAVGDVSEPLVSDRGVRVIQLVAREGGEPPRLEDVEPEVRNELKRRAGDTAVRRLIGDLRGEGRLLTADVLP